MFDGRRQLILVALHVRPELGRGLPELHGRRRRGLRRASSRTCNARDTSFAVVSRAPLAKIEAYKQRTRLDVPVVLVVRERLQLRLPRDARRVGRAGEYNYRTLRPSYEPLGMALAPENGQSEETRAAAFPARRRPRVPHVLGVRAGHRDRSAVRTTSSTRPRSAARRNGRSRRDAPTTRAPRCRTSRRNGRRRLRPARSVRGGVAPIVGPRRPTRRSSRRSPTRRRPRGAGGRGRRGRRARSSTEPPSRRGTPAQPPR